jgi:hypothetical protein
MNDLNSFVNRLKAKKYNLIQIKAVASACRWKPFLEDIENLFEKIEEKPVSVVNNRTDTNKIIMKGSKKMKVLKNDLIRIFKAIGVKSSEKWSNEILIKKIGLIVQNKKYWKKIKGDDLHLLLSDLDLANQINEPLEIIEEEVDVKEEEVVEENDFLEDDIEDDVEEEKKETPKKKTTKKKTNKKKVTKTKSADKKKISKKESSGKTQAAAINDHLEETKGQMLTIEEIAKETNVPEQRVRWHLNKLIRNGKIEKSPTTYKLVK